MKLLFIPNWNGHLHLHDYKDKGLAKIFKKVEYKNKEMVVTPSSTIEDKNNVIGKAITKLGKEKFLAVTGDHSNSYPLFKEFAKNNPNANYVIFDAHPDCEASTGVPSHEDYLRHIIEEGIVKPKQILLLGIRAFSRLEFEFLLEHKIKFFTIADILRDKNSVVKALSKLDNIYLSIDIDSMDPDDAPGTYYSEWCGLRIDEMLEFIKIMKPKVLSGDITEYYEENDEASVTEKNMVKLINSFLK